MDFVQRKVNSLGRKVATFPHVETIGRTLFASSFFPSAWHEPKFGYSGDQIKHLMAVSIMVKTLGELIFIYGSLFGAFLLLLHQGIATTIHHDFYNQRIDTEEFGLLYIKFKRVITMYIASFSNTNCFVSGLIFSCFWVSLGFVCLDP
ncbi:hypothetical protein YC2023_039438 [Brassica napus]